MQRIFVMLAFLAASTSVFAQGKNPLMVRELSEQQAWVDSVYNSMTLKEKIGQLFMPMVFSNAAKTEIDYVKSLVRDYKIGGIIYSKGGPITQAKLNNTLQASAKVPLLISMDAEWGLSMRLDSTYAFPWNMTLGAIKDDDIVREVGKRIGEHCKRLGVHMNFAPVVDININPDNPIIGNRSFGSDKVNVTNKAKAFLEGMQSAGILGSLKHFPGHGDTDQDSHKTLPTIPFSRKRLNDIEMYPYKPLIDAGVASVMVAHLDVPALESRPGYPTSLSSKVVTGILQDSLKFQGLIFTDALNMKGASNFNGSGEVDLQAFKAGNDILLISENIPAGISRIEKAYNDGEITESRLSKSVRKILFAKFKVGLNHYEPVNIKNLYQDLNSPQDEVVYRKAMSAAITVLKNDGAILPVKDLDDKKIAYVKMGDDSGSAFYEQMKKYADVDEVTASGFQELRDKLKDYNYVIFGFHRSNDSPWKAYKLTAREINWIESIAAERPVVLDLFVRPYALKDFNETSNIKGIVMSYQNSEIAQQLSAQMIFGSHGSTGKLPVAIEPDFPVHTSYEIGTLRRLQYGIPEEVNMDSQKLKKIDSLVHVGINNVMFPGAQVLVARNGKVIYEKAFGTHTYTKKDKVELTDVYDVASMTKILATLPLLMERYDQEKLSLNTKLGDILPVLQGSNKAGITIKEVLSHYGRLVPWIPFYVPTLEDGKPSKKYYHTRPDEQFDIQVADAMYMRHDYQDTIIKVIADSDLLSRAQYKYSDLSYYLFKKYLEDTSGKDLNQLTQEDYYTKLGAYRLGYLPLDRFSKEEIIPTENDQSFRMQQILGYVHDQGAAMEGGIGGHAGIFGNVDDIAKVMQMYLQNGYYGGKRFFSQKTMSDFNTRYYESKGVRRGVGFDKQQLSGGGPTCGCVSSESFGHSGFTGTLTWADPKSGILYIFLSNRVHPFADNRKLISSGLRTEIQQAIQDAIIM
ncbi:MAG: beta-N-acetylglucosaminidase [Cytophagaceae bacterium]|nr:beta-N-acetylglucosaminidase [Cytophagaceae bacterium]